MYCMKKYVKLIALCLAAMLMLAGCGEGNTADVDSAVDSSVESTKTNSSNGVKSQAPKEVLTHTPEQTIEMEGAKYELTFFDDFLGTELDPTKWERSKEQKRQDVNGWWDDDCSYLDGYGSLILTAEADPEEDGKYLAGAVWSRGIFEQARGYFECRVRLQQSPGFWSAFWLYTSEQRNLGEGAKNGAEIDIYESYKVTGGHINHAIHYDGYGEHHRIVKQSTAYTTCYDYQYHTFGLLWTENEYIWYIDGKEVWRLSEGDEEFPGSCEKECFLWLSNEFGTWAGKANEDRLPDNVAFDYVKVYQKAE